MAKTAGRWPWKSASAKECVTTHRPSHSAPKKDDAQAVCSEFATVIGTIKMPIVCRRARHFVVKQLMYIFVELMVVQILVAVAITLVQSQRAEVEQVSANTAKESG